MRRGCISLGDVQCDECKRIVPHSERYLAIDVEDSVEGKEEGKTLCYCMECALKKGYAQYKYEKDETILTIFPQTDY